MPITVKHDSGDISGLAALLMAAGAGQHQAPQPMIAPVGPSGQRSTSGSGKSGKSMFGSIDKAKALRASAQQQDKQIQAQADMQKSANKAAAGRAGVAAGLGRDMQEIEYQQEVEMRKQAAKDKAAEVDYVISAEDRREAQKISRDQKYVRDAVNEGRISPEEGRQLEQALNQKAVGLTPTAIPAGPKPPEPQELVVNMPDGEQYTKEPNGGLRHIDPKTTLKGQQAERQFEIAKAERKADEDFLISLGSATVTTKDDGPGQPMSPEQKSQAVKDYAANKAQIRGESQQGGATQQRRAVDQRNEAARVNAKRKWDEQHGGGQADEFFKKAEEGGIKAGKKTHDLKFTDRERQMGPQAGAAMAIFRTFEEKYKTRDQMSYEEKKVYDAASQIVEKIYGGR